MRAALIASSTFAALAFENEPQEWSEFKASHGKAYDDSLEELRRFEIFSANVKFVQAENQKGHDFDLAVNEFADLTPEELAEHSGLRELPTDAGMPLLGTHTWRGEDLPEELDWSEKGAVTPVKNQGSCGSCWAFSAIGALEGASAVAGSSLEQFSEQQLVDCAGKKYGNFGCNGGLMDFAFNYSMDHVICTEDSYPYQGKDSDCQSNGCKVGLEKGRVAGYQDVGHTAEDLMSAIAQQPVAVAIEADMPFFQFYHGGVFSTFCGGSLDHGVLAVGYGVWPKNNKKYWKVKNSWGAKWGKDGYILLNRETKPWRKMGECGILKSASFPQISSEDVVV